MADRLKASGMPSLSFPRGVLAATPFRFTCALARADCLGIFWLTLWWHTKAIAVTGHIPHHAARNLEVRKQAQIS